MSESAQHGISQAIVLIKDALGNLSLGEPKRSKQYLEQALVILKAASECVANPGDESAEKMAQASSEVYKALYCNPENTEEDIARVMRVTGLTRKEVDKLLADAVKAQAGETK